jgi:hypothetical protein
VARQQQTTTQQTTTRTRTATFRMTEPRGEGGMWYSDFTVVVKDDGTFTGTDDVYGVANPGDMYGVVNPGDKLDEFSEQNSGTITETGGKYYVSLTAKRDPNVIDGYSLTNAPMDGVTSSTKAVYPNPGWNVEVKVTEPVFTPTTTTTTTDYKNHGDFVSSQGGGSDAAHTDIAALSISERV